MDSYINKSPYIVLFILGYFTGRFISSSPTKITSKIETQSVSTTKQDIQTLATVKKDSATSLQTIVVNKSYSPNGKLSNETVTRTRLISKAKVDLVLTKKVAINTHVAIQTKSETVTSYQSNWLVGLSVPASINSMKMKDVRATLNYRLIGSYYIFVESDYQLKTPRVGILFPL